MENCQYTSLQIIQQLKTVFRIIISANQLSIYGAVAIICEEFAARQDGSGESDVLMGQSIVLEEIKAEIPLQNDNSIKSSNSVATVHGTNRITLSE